MMSKVQPTADYWTIDRENLVTRFCYFWWAEKQRAKWWNSFKNGEMFWMSNKAIIEFSFHRLQTIWRILQISEGVIHLSSVDNTLLDLQNSSYPTQPHSIIANCLMRTKKVCLFFVEELFFQLAQDYSKEEELPVGIGKCRLSLRKNIAQDLNKKYFYFRIHMLFAGWEVHTEGLKLLPEAAGQGQHFQAQGHSFSLYGLTLSRQITFIFFLR